ncbi:MAG: prephenate dehydrogenase, partial [Clostridia bacterium]|nr:prephenate dehydrogenase [Clostridia bacterium]
RSAWADPRDAPIESQDILMLCLPPDACVEFIQKHAMRMQKGSILTDVCGVKRPLKEAVDALPDHPFHYLGGHPMAGKERGSFANASPDLYRGAHYILTPDADVPEAAIHEMQQLIQFIGCADSVITSPEEHDARIGYTSQLMHIMALALCDQHLLFESYGFEGGSFRGATRVAALDPDLWCELFWANRETLADLVDELRENLDVYAGLLRGGDRAALLEQLRVSSDRKKAFDHLRGLDRLQAPLFK